LLSQEPDTVPQVLKNRFHHAAAPDVVAAVLPAREIAESFLRARDGYRRRRAVSLVVFGAHAHVELELLAISPATAS
jgi:hypothetical protein